MFYLLAFLSVVSALYMVYSNNVVYSLMCLITVFFLCGLILLTLRLEFLGYMLVIVYVGALAILFLFVVMTLDISKEEKNMSIIRRSGGYLPHFAGLAYSVGLLVLVHDMVKGESAFLAVMGSSTFDNYWSRVILNNSLNAIGLYLYTHKFLYLMLAGLLLLIAMVGAVLLTLGRVRPNQDTQKQQYQTYKKSAVCNKRKPRQYK